MSSEHQQNIFGGLLIDLVPSLEAFESEIDTFFSKQKVLSYEQKIQCNDQLLTIEKELHSKLKPNESSLLNSLNNLINKKDPAESTPFLSDAAIEHILNTHPPTTLEASPELQSAGFSNRTKLALSRFTEDRNWQHSYHEILNKLQFSDFAYRQPECVEVSAHKLATLATTSGHTLKPWGLSHSKETGVIIYFDGHESNVPTPTLLTVAVFLHYLHEVEHYSKFLEANKNLQAGQLTKNIIRSKEPILPFLTDGNAHDETIYWKEALRDLSKLIKIPPELLTNGITKDNDNTVESLNFVDLIWNLNSIGGIKNHMYHLQQEKWFELLTHLTTLTEEEFGQKAKNSLMLDNLSFMQKLLKYT